MRYKSFFLAFLLLIIFLFYQCDIKPKDKEISTSKVYENDCIIENKILNEIFPSLFDSLSKISEIRNGTTICYSDSMVNNYDLKPYFHDNEIRVDTFVNKETSCKLLIESYIPNNEIKLQPVRTPSEYSELREKDTSNYLLFVFSRIYFNNSNSKSFFTLSVMSTLSSGRIFTIILEKNNVKWEIKKITMFGII